MSAAGKELAKLHGELVERRARLLGEVKTVDADLAALVRAAAIVDPEVELAGPKRRGRPAMLKQQVAFRHGEFTSEVLRVLREAGEPLNARETVEAILRAKGFAIEDVRAAPLTTKVSSVIKNLADGGRVRRLDGGDHVRWEIAR